MDKFNLNRSDRHYIHSELNAIKGELQAIFKQPDSYCNPYLKNIFERLDEKIMNLVNFLVEKKVPDEHDYLAALVICQKKLDELQKHFGFLKEGEGLFDAQVQDTEAVQECRTDKESSKE